MSALNDLMVAVADSIRAKEGSSEKIAPVDFPQRIDNLQVGGGTSESNIEYLDVSGLMEEFPLLCKMFFTGAYSAKGVVGDTVWICSPYMFLYQGIEANIEFVAIDMNQLISLGTDSGTLKEALTDGGYTQEQLDSIPRITKEQFYDLSD